MAFYDLPSPWNPGYAIPDYVMAEPPGRGTFTTKWLERGTISQLLPNILGSGSASTLQGKGGMGSLGGASLGGGIVGSVQGLGNAAPGRVKRPGFPGDPIAAYGQRAADFLVTSVQRVDPRLRQVALKALLDELDPGLYAGAAAHAEKLIATRKYDPKTALKRGLAISMADGLAKELLEAGRTGRIVPVSQAGLGTYGEPAMRLAMGGLWGAIKKGASAVGSAAKGAFGAAASLPGQVVDKAKDWGGSALSTLGSMACSVLNSGAAQMAAGGAALASGVPPQVGAAGANVAKGFCKNEVAALSPAPYSPPPAAGGMSPILLIGGGAAVVAAAYLLLKKR